MTKIINCQSTQDILNEANSLAAIMRTVKKLKSLKEIINSLLPIELRDHCQVINIDKGRLILEVDNNSLGSVLHYAKPDILQKLRQNSLFSGLISIEHRVNPSLKIVANKSKPNLRPPIQLSSNNLQQLAEFAENTEDEQLKMSLLKLLKHQQKR